MNQSPIDDAVDALKKSGVVAFPTDTVYGLGADMVSEKAVERLFEIKLRSRDNPVPVMIADKKDLKLVVNLITDTTYRIIERYWPGPLTIVLPKSPSVPDLITGGKNTVAVRIPDHPVALKLLSKFGSPMAVTSANLSGQGPFTTYEEVLKTFGDKVDFIVPGDTIHKQVSTIIDLTGEKPVVVREGLIKLELNKLFL